MLPSVIDHNLVTTEDKKKHRSGLNPLLTQTVESFPIIAAGLTLTEEMERLLQPVSSPLPLDLTEVHAVDVGHLLPLLDGPAGHQVVHLPHVDPDSVGAAGVVEVTPNDRKDAAADGLLSREMGRRGLPSILSPSPPLPSRAAVWPFHEGRGRK